MTKQATLAVLGGTGKEGRGLVLRWANAEINVLLGSRSMERAVDSAQAINEKLGSERVRGMLNEDAAIEADVIVSTLPADGQTRLLESIATTLSDKLFITAAIIWPPSPERDISSAEQAKQVLGESSRVAAAFQTVSAGTLSVLPSSGSVGDEGAADLSPTEDSLIIADSEATGIEAVEWVNLTGIRGVLASTELKDARTAEAMTGILLKINKRYGVKSTGLSITRLITESKTD